MSPRLVSSPEGVAIGPEVRTWALAPGIWLTSRPPMMPSLRPFESVITTWAVSTESPARLIWLNFDFAPWRPTQIGHSWVPKAGRLGIIRKVLDLALPTYQAPVCSGLVAAKYFQVSLTVSILNRRSSSPGQLLS